MSYDQVLIIVGFIAIAFAAGTIASVTISYIDRYEKTPSDALVKAIDNLTTTINNKQTTVIVNAPQGPPGPKGQEGKSGIDCTNLVPGAVLIGCDLHGKNVPEANLLGAILISADLSDANLSGASLSGANLISADLSYADLSGANLNGANLINANLISTNLDGASLINTNLSGANLNGTNLNGTNLSGTNLSGANLNYTKFFGCHGKPIVTPDSATLPACSP